MIEFTKIKCDKDFKRLKCGICGNDFKEAVDIYISQNNIGFICERCMKKFSKVEIDEFLHLINQYMNRKASAVPRSFLRIIIPSAAPESPVLPLTRSKGSSASAFRRW